LPPAVATRSCVEGPRPDDGVRAEVGLRLQRFDRRSEGVQLGRVDPAARGPHRLALQRPPHLAHVADVPGGHPADDRAAVREQIDQLDQGLADRGVADPEPVGQRLRDEPLAGRESALQDLGQDRADEGLAAQPVVEPGFVGGADEGHTPRPGTDSGRECRRLGRSSGHTHPLMSYL
jgi:hypothetical protein